MQVKLDTNYNKEDWIEWGKKENALALVGAVDFFNYAKSKGIEVFYISNRYEVQLNETVKNLIKLGLPNADNQHVFLKTHTSKKTRKKKYCS